MTKDQALKLALMALKKCRYRSLADEIVDPAITAINEALAQPEQKPVAWPCSIAEADFEQNTITIDMHCADYKVGAGQHWLTTAPPQRKPLPPQSPCEMTPAERKMFRLGWLECEAAHGIKENT